VLLGKLLGGIVVKKLFMMQYGAMAQTQDIEIGAVRYDSRLTGHNDLFVAIPGTATDGQRFVAEAISRGSIAVVLEDDAAVPDALFLHTHVVKIVVPNARIALAQIAANFFDHPARRLRLIGVTGTNGKTTTTHLIKAALEAHGERVGLIGTIHSDLGGAVVPATHTTPESLELNSMLHTMLENGCTAAVMEVSSHALSQHRVHGLHFAAGVFTNLTQDHLDYHGTMDEYLAAKKILFDDLLPGATAITNADDAYGDTIVNGTKARVLRYAVNAPADLRARDVAMSVNGMKFAIDASGRSTAVTTTLTGRFNVANILGAFGAATATGVPPDVAASGIGRLKSVRGRFEPMVSPDGWTAIIDYAHTPDALENVLQAIRQLLPAGAGGRLITVFGCGGNRDRTKRPVMGRIAAEMSDVTIVTSDNPRKEDPQEIIREVLTGAPPNAVVHTDADRRSAIALALSMARAGDVVLIAGKGHEDYQVVGTSKMHLDDREEVEAYLRRHP
jgi:UDP-N-acetylmuramoyl-L-alanyl-D-glutamate--2,6-diaminopimelate ligase